LNAILVPAAADLIAYVADALDQEARDLSDCLVVFPGRRPGHFLRRRIAERRRESFVPPHIVSIDELVDELSDARHPGRPDLESIDAVALLYEIHSAFPSPLGGHAFLSPDMFFPIGARIYADLEELRIEGVDPRSVGEVQPLIEEQIPPRSRESLQALEIFYKELYLRIEALGYSTRSSRYWEVCSTIAEADLSRFRRIILAGFYAPTRAERKLFAMVGALSSALFVFQDGPGMGEKLSQMGIRAARDGRARDGGSGEPSIRLFQSPDGHGQVFALNALLHQPDERTVIVLPAADTLFPLQRHCLSRFQQDAYNISLGYPLVRTPVYGFLNDLMELVDSMEGERVYVPRYLTFMLHPYTKNALFHGSAAATRMLLHTMEETLGGTRTRLFVTLPEIEEDGELLEQAALGIAADGTQASADELRGHLHAVHSATIGRLRSFTDVKDFADRCIEVLSWVHDVTTARDHPFFSPFAQSIIESLEAISRSLMGGTVFQDPRSYFTLLRRYLEGRYQRFPGTPLRGLQVLGSLETRNLAFDRVFVLDAVEGIIPQSGAEDSLLPLSVRAALGLTTRKDREEMERYYFSLLSAGARELTVFFTDDGEKQKSRFVEQLLWEMQKRDGTTDTRPYVRRIQYAVNLENRPPAAVEKTQELVSLLEARPFSASALDAYLRCPLSFYYSRVLGLSKRDEATGGFEKVDIGILVHAILAEFFRPTVGRDLEQSDLDAARMASIVDRQFSGIYGSSETGAGLLLRTQIRRHLTHFLDDYQRPVLRESRVTMVALEERLARDWEGFTLAGRLDAVQRRGNELLVIDYKTGHDSKSLAVNFQRLDPENRETWSAAIGTLQLPFYLLLREGQPLKAHPASAPEAARAMFLLLGRTRLDRSIELPLFKDREEEERELPRLQAVILAILREIVSLDVPFFPTENRKRMCPTCDFNAICGTRWLSR
jgi:ATP-dependent helicase/nuclease subunit B